MNRLLEQKLFFRLVIIVITSLVSLNANTAQSNHVMYAQQQYEAAQAIRDPFTPSSLMFDAISHQGNGSGAAGYGFMRSPSKVNLPKMRLRGYVGQSDDKPVALLEVAGARTYIIHEGDEINIDPAIPNSAIRVTKITRFSVTVEAGMLGSIRVQR